MLKFTVPLVKNAPWVHPWIIMHARPWRILLQISSIMLCSSLVPMQALYMGGWRRAWYTLIADPPTFPRGFLSQCVTMCNNDILIVYIVC